MRPDFSSGVLCHELTDPRTCIVDKCVGEDVINDGHSHLGAKF